MEDNKEVRIIMTRKDRIRNAYNTIGGRISVFVIVLIAALYFGNTAAEAAVPLVKLYYNSYSDCLTQPSAYPSRYQISAKAGAKFEIKENQGNYQPISVSSSGLVTVNDLDYHAYDKTTVVVTEGTAKREIAFSTYDYADIYADQVMDRYLKNEIKSSMTDLEKYKKIAEIVARDFDYSSESSGWIGLIITGKGSCYASTYFIVEACERLGIQADWRRDGPGSSHINASAMIDGKIYIADAGYTGTKPRYYSVFERGDFSYYGNEDGQNTITVYQYERDWPFDGTSKKIVIPEKIDGNTVTEIADGFYPSAHDTQEYVLPKTLLRIGENAFYFNENLSKINFPASLTEIGAGAFQYCRSLEKIVIPGKVTELPDLVFANCWNLKTVTIPKSVVTISDTAFQGSDEVKLMVYKNSAAHTYAKQNGMDYDIIGYSPSQFGNVVKLPDSLRIIDQEAFLKDQSVKCILVGPHVTEIKAKAFADMPELSLVVIPDTVRKIADNAFDGSHPAIRCAAGSTAEQFAKTHGLDYCSD